MVTSIFGSKYLSFNRNSSFEAGNFLVIAFWCHDPSLVIEVFWDQDVRLVGNVCTYLSIVGKKVENSIDRKYMHNQYFKVCAIIA